MYQNFYAEVLDGAPQTVRANERGAILHSIKLMELAERAGPQSLETVEALLFLRRIWEFFLIHLADQENQLPDKLRADLISIGISILREVERVRLGDSRDFTDLKAISLTIAEGLA